MLLRYGDDLGPVTRERTVLLDARDGRVTESSTAWGETPSGETHLMREARVAAEPEGTLVARSLSDGDVAWQRDLSETCSSGNVDDVDVASAGIQLLVSYSCTEDGTAHTVMIEESSGNTLWEESWPDAPVPGAPDEVALATATHRQTGHNVGDRVEVHGSNGRTHGFTVVSLVNAGIDSLNFRGGLFYTPETAVEMTGREDFVKINIVGADGPSQKDMTEAVSAVVGAAGAGGDVESTIEDFQDGYGSHHESLSDLFRAAEEVAEERKENSKD
ncbi:hypothetical protein [Nocardiopsis synnemataformans]|uniref:hypothetical protein n=1 Tax=Nocardiopsis synnemataformans TaxID=61305 RepID=UPI003EB7A17D